MTTILHVSDTHLGKRQYSSDIRRADFAAAFDEALDIACGTHPDHGNDPVDAVVHTGDLFDQRTPPLPEVRNCVRLLRKLERADIPFYGIVGNHERKMDDQWLDLLEETGTAKRLDRTPTMVGEVAVYGIDSVTKPAWETTDFELEEPGEDSFRLLCMHQLLSPPVPEIMADHPSAEALEKTTGDIDALALGDYHEAEEAVVDGVDVWYSGSTERCSAGEEASRGVSLLEIEAGELTKRALELDTRAFRSVTIEFGENDGHGHAERTIERHDLDGTVAVVRLTGERTSVTASAVYDLALERGAAVCSVNDDRGRETLDPERGPTGTLKRPDERIEERLAEESLHEVTMEVEARVRGDPDLATNRIAEWAEGRIRTAQGDAFEADAADGPNGAETPDDDTEIEASGVAGTTNNGDSRLDSWASSDGDGGRKR